MTTPSTTTADPTPPNAGPPAPAPVETQPPATPPATPPAAPAAPTPETFTKQQLDERVTKARGDEKSKVRQGLDEAKAAQAAAEARVVELKGKQTATQKELDDVRAGTTSDLESVQREMSELREQNTSLTATVEAVADAATDKIAAAELKAYRREKIAASGLTTLADLVTGDSEESIDASIAKTKEREEAIASKARDEVREELGSAVPTPISPGGGSSTQPSGVTAGNKKELASLKGDAWKRKRAELLAEAKQRSGIT